MKNTLKIDVLIDVLIEVFDKKCSQSYEWLWKHIFSQKNY